MSRALAQAPPQPTRIRLAAGDYAGLGSYSNVQRTAANPIAITGATDADGEPSTIVDGGANGVAAAGAMCIGLRAASYVVVENIRCQNAFPHGANIDDAINPATPTHHLVIRNWRVRNVGVFLDVDAAANSDCLKLSGVDDFWILDSEMENCVRGEFIDMVGAHRGVIARNYFHDKPWNGIQTKGGSSDILITRNTLERVELRFIQLGGGVGPEDYRPTNAPYPASRIDVIANVIRDVGVYGATASHRSTVFSLNGCNDCLVAHNTVLGMQYQALLVYIDKEDSLLPGNNDITLANNVYLMDDRENRPRSTSANPLEMLVSARGEQTASEARFVNEVYFEVEAPGQNPVDFPASIQPQQFQGIGIFDPQLDANAHLSATSPARQFGTRAYENRVPADYFGVGYGSPPDAGAFSSQSVRPNPPTQLSVAD
jgi:hypothetical protein